MKPTTSSESQSTFCHLPSAMDPENFRGCHLLSPNLNPMNPNQTVRAGDSGKASYGEAFGLGTNFLQSASLLIPECFAGTEPIPKGLRPPAQGCEPASYPGILCNPCLNPSGVVANRLWTEA